MANIRNMMNVGVEAAKRNFFDRAAVISAVDKAEARFMSKFGAYVRSDANQSMKRTRTTRPSNPGTPPRAHRGDLKRFNFFQYDARQHDVVIGPILLPGSRYAVPGLHEHGGSVVPRRSTKNRAGKLATYPARPFMRPALMKNLKRVDELRGSVRK